MDILCLCIFFVFGYSLFMYIPCLWIFFVYRYSLFMDILCLWIFFVYVYSLYMSIFFVYGHSLFMDILCLWIFIVYGGGEYIFFSFKYFSLPSLVFIFHTKKVSVKKKLSIFNVYVAPGRGFLSRVQQNLGLPVIKYRDRVQKQAKP